MNIEIRALLMQDVHGWVVQGVEYDISAHGANISRARKAFERALVERCMVAEHLGLSPMAGLKPAPERFRLLFEQAEEELMRVKGSHYPSVPPVKMRLAQAA